MNFGMRIAVCDDETGTCSGIENMILDFLIKPVTKKKVDATLEKFIRLRGAGRQEFYYHAGRDIWKDVSLM